MVLLLLGTFVDLVLGDSSDTDSASPKKSKQIHLADYKQEVTENGVSITSADGNELKKEETKYGSIEEKHDIMSPEKPKSMQINIYLKSPFQHSNRPYHSQINVSVFIH